MLGQQQHIHSSITVIAEAMLPKTIHFKFRWAKFVLAEVTLFDWPVVATFDDEKFSLAPFFHQTPLKAPLTV
jgi:hypothetical protein